MPGPAKIQFVEQSKGGGGSSGMGMLLVNVLISAVISFGVVNFMAAKKSDFDTLKTELTTSVAATSNAFAGRVAAVEARPQVDTSLPSRISALEAKAATDLSIYSKKTDDEALAARIKVLEDWKTGTGTTVPGTTITPIPGGQIGYAIVNPQVYYTLSSGNTYPIDVKITNNKSDARYVRPQISLTTFQSSNAGTVGTATCTITSNSQGQNPVTFTYIATPTVAVNNIVFIANGGGATTAGEYLVGSGVVMDFYTTITIVSTNPVLWTLTVSGSDRSITQ